MQKFLQIGLRRCYNVHACFFLEVICTLLVYTGPAIAIPNYEITDLGLLPEGSFTRAYDVNDNGQVTGYGNTVYGIRRPYIWDVNHGFTVLNAEVHSGENGAINNNGQVAGTLKTGELEDRAFISDANGRITELNTPAGSDSVAQDINNNGQVVGSSFDGDLHAFVGNEQGVTRVDVPGSASGLTSLGNLSINDQGQIAGTAAGPDGESHAFIGDTANGFTDLGVLVGNISSINNSGQFAGQRRMPSGFNQAFVGDMDGYTGLGTLDGTEMSVGSDINDRGQVVGFSRHFLDNGDFSDRAFVGDVNGGLYDLNDLVINRKGWNIIEAEGINNNGSIVGTGFTKTGATHAFLLSPIAPEGIDTPQQYTPKRTLPDPAAMAEQSVPSDTKNSGDRGLVFITHGWNRQDTKTYGKWIGKMAKSIAGNLHSDMTDHSSLDDYTRIYWADNPDWTVWSYDWSDDAATGGLNPFAALNRGLNIGQGLVQAMEKQGVLKKFDKFHFIAHSAGAGVISSAVRELANQGVIGNDRNARKDDGVEVQMTFLDAFKGLGGKYENTYGNGATGTGPKIYGKYADWAENYYTSLMENWSTPRTNGPYKYAHNVDVGGLAVAERMSPGHSWPRIFYQDTVNGIEIPGAHEYGWGLSIEAGGYSPDKYPENNDSVKLKWADGLLGVSGTLGAKPIRKLRIDDRFIFNDSEYLTSDTGTVGVDFSQLTLETGSPVWIAIEERVNDPVNMLFFDTKFLSDDGAEGLLSVFWDGGLLGTIDERYAADAGNNWLFGLNNELGPGLYTLAFRLDPFTDISSRILISNVRTGRIAAASMSVPEPSSLPIVLFGFMVLMVLVRCHRLQ